jgi:hypothetical protein
MRFTSRKQESPLALLLLVFLAGYEGRVHTMRQVLLPLLTTVLVIQLCPLLAEGAKGEEQAAQMKEKPPGDRHDSNVLKERWPEFLAIDLASGYSRLDIQLGELNEEGEEMPTKFGGFEVDATVRFKRWLGVAGSYVRNGNGEATFQQVLVGPRFNTPYVGRYYTRGFAHVLLGRAHVSSPLFPSESSFEMVIGGGVDMFGFLRTQIDYVRFDLGGYPTNNVRVSGGGVVPLCLKGCDPRGSDGMVISAPH